MTCCRCSICVTDQLEGQFVIEMFLSGGMPTARGPQWHVVRQVSAASRCSFLSIYQSAGTRVAVLAPPAVDTGHRNSRTTVVKTSKWLYFDHIQPERVLLSTDYNINIRSTSQSFEERERENLFAKSNNDTNNSKQHKIQWQAAREA